jgi:hypothetical protein
MLDMLLRKKDLQVVIREVFNAPLVVRRHYYPPLTGPKIATMKVAQGNIACLDVNLPGAFQLTLAASVGVGIASYNRRAPRTPPEARLMCPHPRPHSPNQSGLEIVGRRLVTVQVVMGPGGRRQVRSRDVARRLVGTF